MENKNNTPNESREYIDAQIKKMENEIINEKDAEKSFEDAKEAKLSSETSNNEVLEASSPEPKQQDTENTPIENMYASKADEPSRDNEKKCSKAKNMMAATIAICIVSSSILGIGGGFLGYNMAKGKISNPLQIVTSNKGIDNQEPKTNVAEVVNRVGNSVVEITTEVASTDSRFRQYITEGAGSGVIIGSDGYIVTNHHVIDSAQKITVTLKTGESFVGKLLSSDAKTDIALIKIEATGLTAAVFGDSDTLQVGENAIAIGNPLGELGGTVTEGIISALNRDVNIDGESMNLLQTNAAINPGNSGGGLFNSDGELVGLVVAKTSGTGIEGLGFAIPSNEVKNIAKELNEYGYVRGRVDLQMTLVDITTPQQAIMYRVHDTGLYISEVKRSSAAESAGFKPGDRIIAVNSQPTENASKFQNIADKLVVGENATFTVVRNQQQLDISFTLQEYKPSF